MRRRLGLALQWFGGLCLFLALLAGVGLFLAGKWLPVYNAPEKADAIVVLCGSYFRSYYAAELYKQGLAPEVRLSVPYLDRQHQLLQRVGVAFTREEDAHAEILRKKGVPAEAIKRFGSANLSTVQEAIELAKIFSGTGKKLLVVTSGFHVRRTSKILGDICPDCAYRVVGSPYEPFYQNWWTDRETAVAVVMESVKWLFYLAGGRFTIEGRVANAPPSPPLGQPTVTPGGP
jgi:uncharacterized SAM-binding protein YcdF (DUF218 family)